MCSCRNVLASTIVKIGPMLATMDAFPEPMRRMPSVIMKVGTTVTNTAITPRMA